MERKEQENQIRSFDEVWAEIGPHIEREKQRRRNRRRIWTSVGSVCACAVVATAVILPITLYEKPEQPKLYLDDELSSVLVQQDEFYSCLEQTKIDLVDITEYSILSYSVYKTEENQTKGGSLIFVENSSAPIWLVNLSFYDKDVKVSDKGNIIYNLEYKTTNGTEIGYMFNESEQKYSVKAEYNSVKYYMEYTGSAEAITGFFEAFFD